MLVAPLVVLVALSVIQLALVLHTRAVLTAAAGEAVHLAAAYEGDTTAGEVRLHDVVTRDLRDDIVQSTSWYFTLDALTLRLRAHVPVFVWLAPQTMNITATAHRERWL